MHTEETFYRPPVLAQEARHLPAQVYNLAQILLKQGGAGCLFVPVRSMQYMAVLDAEEYIFVHREGRRMIELAWQRFHPGERDSLSDPVPYELVYYSPSGPQTMQRLQAEFYKALQELEARKPPASGPARIVKLDAGGY
jgi:hypothetical protein